MSIRKAASEVISTQAFQDDVGKMELAEMSGLSRPRCRNVFNGASCNIDDIESVLKALGFKFEIVAIDEKLSFATPALYAEYKREIDAVNMKYKG